MSKKNQSKKNQSPAKNSNEEIKQRPPAIQPHPCNGTDIPIDLYDRARKLGITDEQILAAGSAENLKALCDQVSPQTDPDALVKPDIQPPAPPKPVTHAPAKVEMVKDDIRAEQDTLASFHRKMNVKYNSPEMKTITKIVEYDCATRRVVSATFEIE
jgi:hypothetical protein